jgi:uncharacterized protein (TIRG00374 family)
MLSSKDKQRKEKQKKKPWLKWLQFALMLGILVFLGFGAAKFLNGREIWNALDRFRWEYAPLILGASLLYLVFSTWRFRTLMAPLSNVPGWAIARGYLGAQPASMIPGGVALRAAIFTRLGVPAACSSAAILSASLLDQLLMIVVTCIAALWFRQVREAAMVAVAILVLLSLLFAIPAARRWIVRMLEKLAGRFGWREHMEDFIGSLGELASVRTLLGAALLSVLTFTAAVTEFMFVLHSIGVKLPFWSALLAYTLPSMMGRIFITPGGIGVTEGGMIGLLSVVAHVSRNTAAAGSALFRVTDSFFQSLVGAVIYLVFWRGGAEDKWLPKEQQHEDSKDAKKDSAPAARRRLKAAQT